MSGGRVVSVDAATSTVSASPATIVNNGVDSAIVTVRCINTDGNPMQGLAAARITCSSTGSDNTFVAVDTACNRLGDCRFTYTSTSAASKTISATVCGRSVTDTASVTVSGSGFPAADMAAWTFVGASNDARSGPLHDGVNAAFLGSNLNTWTWSATAGPSGGPAATVTYPASGSNQGTGWAINNAVRGASIPANTKNAYCATWHQFATGADIGDPWKAIRFQTAIGGGHSGSFTNSPSLGFFWDNLNGSVTYLPTTNLPAPTAASLVGAWHHVEIEWDISDETDWLMRCRIWIDGVMYWDYTTAGVCSARAVPARSALSLTQVQGYGVVNRLDSESTQLIGAGGLSTTRIGGY